MDQEFSDLLLLDIEKVRDPVGEPHNIGAGSARKSSSLNSLNSKKQYSTVQSKVKSYIAALPAPAGPGKRKTFKKHLSMPGELGHSQDSITAQEHYDYKRQSEHTINELNKQINVSVAMITVANNRNDELLDQIAQMHRDMQHLQMQADEFKPTPESLYQFKPKLVCTPKKAMTHNKRRLLEDTAGSFIGQSSSLAVVATLDPDSVPATTPDQIIYKRNLSFNSTATGEDVTRRSGGGTDSGINSSEEIHVLQEVVETSGRDETRRPKRRRLKRFLVRLVCCGSVASTPSNPPKISYKRI